MPTITVEFHQDERYVEAEVSYERDELNQNYVVQFKEGEYQLPDGQWINVQNEPNEVVKQNLIANAEAKAYCIANRDWFEG